jgi:hypothetical protein
MFQARQRHLTLAGDSSAFTRSHGTTLVKCPSAARKPMRAA